jgi:hypothetical protein
MKFVRSTAGDSLLDHRRNEDILEELKVDSVGQKLAQYKQKLLNHYVFSSSLPPLPPP